ncbi:MAG: Acyltransferase family protein [Verrucomicrobia bacterium]|nr:Acyltransferase family protein [Verrucomicrobiota bacterium]
MRAKIACDAAAGRKSGSVDPTASSAAPPPRLWSLDVLRGSCALVVFISHWHLWSDFAPTGRAERFVRAFGENCYDAFVTLTWPTGGHHPAVICFFVLSGFCIHYPFAQRALHGQPIAPWGGYFRRRFQRIMPVYWAACLLGLLLAGLELWHPSGSELLALHATAPLSDVVVRFTGLSGLYPREIFAGNYLLSTVAAEMVMYALYPWFHHHAIRGRWTMLGLVFVTMQVTAVLLLRFFTPFWVFSTVLMFGLFWYIGALVAHFYVKRGARVHGGAFAASWLTFLGLKMLPHFYGLNVLRQAAWALVCALGILWALHHEARHPGSRDHPLVVAMRYSGRISYSLYSMHSPAIMLATWLLVMAGTHDYFLQLAATFTASIAATLLTYYGVERVFYRPRVT